MIVYAKLSMEVSCLSDNNKSLNIVDAQQINLAVFIYGTKFRAVFIYGTKLQGLTEILSALLNVQCSYCWSRLTHIWTDVQ